MVEEVRILKVMKEDQLRELLKELPQYCRTGVFFADIINRVNGREPVIKGISRTVT